jgi:hypothetical protein
MTNVPRTPPSRTASIGPLSVVRASPRVVANRTVFASPWPMIVAAAALVGSVTLIVTGVFVGELTVLLPEPRIQLTLPQVEFWGFGWVGYLLTPLTTITALVIDRVLQGRGLANPQFIPRPTFGVVLKAVAAASIVVSLWHILTIAVPLVEFVQELGQ